MTGYGVGLGAPGGAAPPTSFNESATSTRFRSPRYISDYSSVAGHPSGSLKIIHVAPDPAQVHLFDRRGVD